MNISYNFYVDESDNIVIEFVDLESGYSTGAKIYHEEIEFLKDNQYDIYKEISYCTFKALLLLVRRINDIKGANKMNYYKKGCEPENKRYIHIAKDDSDIYQDTKTNEILSDYVILERLNEQDKTIKELNEYCTACDDTLITIQELTYKLLSIDFAGVKSKADYCRLLNELDNKDLSFIHDCIEAINKCDLMKMEELKREYGDMND